MKIVVIGDIHGHSTWKDIVIKQDFDKIIFLGDYFDCFAKISPAAQVKNFNDIVDYRSFCLENNKECILCLGNHDYSYASNSSCSGYNYAIQALLGKDIFNLYQNKVLVPFHVEGNIVFSHAGISNVWISDILRIDLSLDLDGDLSQLDHENMFKLLDFNTYTGYNEYGDTPSQSPIWIRPKSLLDNKIEGYTQVVGHTPNNAIKVDKDIWFCDTLPSEYLTIIDGVFTINKL